MAFSRSSHRLAHVPVLPLNRGRCFLTSRFADAMKLKVPRSEVKNFKAHKLVQNKCRTGTNYMCDHFTEPRKPFIHVYADSNAGAGDLSRALRRQLLATVISMASQIQIGKRESLSSTVNNVWHSRGRSAVDNRWAQTCALWSLLVMCCRLRTSPRGLQSTFI